MTTLSTPAFLNGLPEITRPLLPAKLQGFQVRFPYRSLLQLHYGEPALHYEVGQVPQRPGWRAQGWELGFHCESRDHHLNRLLLDGFRRHLFEIKSVLGEGIEAEMWDRGWTKIYEVSAGDKLTAAYQEQLGRRLSEIIACLHPIFVDLRRAAAEIYR
jgi:hypothetical protein